MANHLSTEKAIRKTAKKAGINKNRRTRVRTYIKKVVSAVESASVTDSAGKALIFVQSEMMRAVSKGLIKKNTASRKISRLAKKVKLASTTEVVK
ncbi:MAG: 30S ribosomal protein S20 [Rickettsiaceae bacterium]